MSPPVALLIEDAEEFVVLGRSVLQREGFDVIVAHDGETGVQLARSDAPELVVIDINLPGIDGYEVCRTIRSFTDAYIVMVTSRNDDIEKVVGYRVGADDYVTKPYSPAVLAARIAAMRRRPRMAVGPAPRSFGSLSIDPEARVVTQNGEPLALTKIEFELLDLLTEAPRRTFTRAHLLEHIWGSSEYGDDHVVDVHVANLRRKLGETAASPRHVQTVRGVGYRFDPA